MKTGFARNYTAGEARFGVRGLSFLDLSTRKGAERVSVAVHATEESGEDGGRAKQVAARAD